MSNWSSVIITWNGIDKEAEDADRRAKQIAARFLRASWCEYFPMHVSPSCPHDDSLGSTCEVVILAHCNHFDHDAMIDVLGSFEWEYPSEVELMDKNEDMDQYRHWHLVECREAKDEIIVVKNSELEEVRSALLKERDDEAP